MKTFIDRTNELSGDILDHEIPARWLMNSVVVNRDMSMGAGFEIDLPYLGTAGESTVQHLHLSIRTLLNQLPKSIDCQVIFDQDHDGNAVIEEITKVLPSQKIARALVEEKSRILAKGFANADLRRLHCYLIVVRKNHLPTSVFAARAQEAFAKGDGERKPGVLARFFHKIRSSLDNAEKHFQYEAEEFESALTELAAAANRVESELIQIRANPRLLSNDDILKLMYRFWNPATFDRGGRPKPYSETDGLPLTEYFLRDPVKWSTKGTLLIDGQYHRIMTVRTPASPMRFTDWNDLLLHLGMTKIRLIVNVQHGNVQKRIKYLRTHRLPQLREQAAKDPSKEAQFLEVEDEIRELGKDREHVWHATQVIHLWGNTEAEVEDAVGNVRAYGEKQNGMVISSETDAAWNYWVFSQPFWTRDMDRCRDLIYNTSQLATQLPAITIPTGFDGKIAACFETTARTVFNLFFHDDQFTNANALILGGSGTGKSFLLNSIIAEMGRFDPISIIVDLGGSYRAMCEAQGGHYIDMDLSSRANCMNPLALPPGEQPDPDHIEAMSTFVEKLLLDPSKNTNGHLPTELKSILDRSLAQLVTRSEGKEFFLSDLRETMSTAYADRGGSSLALRLEPWCKGRGGMPTRYGNLFDGPTQIDLSNRFIVFDLSKIKDNKELGAIMFSTIIRHVTMLGERFPGRVKLLAFDEAWSFLEDPTLARFIMTGFRALRKAGFATIGVSQSVNEFCNTSNAGAIVNNLAHRIILRLPPQEVATIADVLHLNEVEAAHVPMLETNPGLYSQALVLQSMADGSTRSVKIVNRPSPLGYWCATTNPKDRQMIAQYRASGMSYMDALVKLAQEYPHGIVKAAA